MNENEIQLEIVLGSKIEVNFFYFYTFLYIRNNIILVRAKYLGTTRNARCFS